MELSRLEPKGSSTTIRTEGRPSLPFVLPASTSSHQTPDQRHSFLNTLLLLSSYAWELLQIKFCNILVSHMRRFDLIVVVVPCFAFSHMRHLGTTITKVIVGFPISCLGFLYHNLRRRSIPDSVRFFVYQETGELLPGLPEQVINQMLREEEAKIANPVSNSEAESTAAA